MLKMIIKFSIIKGYDEDIITTCFFFFCPAARKYNGSIYHDKIPAVAMRGREHGER